MQNRLWLVTQDRASLQSGLAHSLSLVRIVECYYFGVCGVFLFFFFFGFPFLIQRPLSRSPTAARHFASLGQQGAARRGAFLCAWRLAREDRLWRTLPKEPGCEDSLMVPDGRNS
jgi:hypothetical protein